MKKKLFLRFSLMLLVGVSAFSCRTEEFYNEEEVHGNTGLRLTSQRIRLNEAKHRVQLLTEIDKAENTLKGFTKMNVHGKMVNYGNGVSIDTDHVIYIENGPNYHTYTFHIARDNAPADAPLENLLLSPLPDGSYQEFLVTYNLTAQEKQKLLNGEPVNTKGKTKITELAKGTFNSGGQLARKTCGWGEETIWQSCSEGVHNASNVELWHTCKASTPPMVFTVAAWVCTTIPEQQPEYIAAPENGGGGGGGLGEEGQGPPEDCTSIATDPTQVGLVSPTGCNMGIVTEPNIRPSQTPCGRALADINDPVFKQQFNNLNTDANYNNIHEKGIFERSAPIGSGLPSAFIPISNQSCTSHLDLPANKDGITGFFHIHNNNTCSNNPAFPSKVNIKAPSPKDLRTFFHVIMKQANIYKGSYSKGYFVTMTDWGSYMFKYNGTNWPSNVTGADFARWSDWYNKQYQDLVFEEKMDSDNVKRVFAQFLKEVVQVDGLDVFEITENSASKLDYDPVTKKAVSTPCPKK